MKFTLDIALGNDAMQTSGDIARALHRAAGVLEGVDNGQALTPTDSCSVVIHDDNGNRVGEWAVTP